MSWRVPLCDLDYGPEEIEAVAKVLQSKWLTQGEVTREFEKEFARYLGVRNAVAVSSGTAALHLGLLALGLKPGEEVIVPSLTFVATCNAVRYWGGIPVFADVQSESDFGLSPGSIAHRITRKTRAILVMHFGGHPCDMPSIRKLSKDRGIFLLEDASHAPGSSLDGQKIGTLGDLGCFSFFSNKNLATGEGGMVVTGRDDVAEKIRLLRCHGMTRQTLDRHQQTTKSAGENRSYDVIGLGFNYRLDEMRSALGLVQLGKLDENNGRRRAVMKEYRERLDGVDGISLPHANHRGISAAHIFPVLLDKTLSRSKFMDFLASDGIQTSIHYPPVHLLHSYREEGMTREGLLPLTEEIGKREVTLPLYPDLSGEDIDLVVMAVKRALRHAGEAS